MKRRHREGDDSSDVSIVADIDSSALIQGCLPEDLYLATSKQTSRSLLVAMAVKKPDEEAKRLWDCSFLRCSSCRVQFTTTADHSKSSADSHGGTDRLDRQCNHYLTGSHRGH